jgi:hypothetical protein
MNISTKHKIQFANYDQEIKLFHVDAVNIITISPFSHSDGFLNPSFVCPLMITSFKTNNSMKIRSNLKLYSEGLFAHRPESVYCSFVMTQRMGLYNTGVVVVVLPAPQLLKCQSA